MSYRQRQGNCRLKQFRLLAVAAIVLASLGGCSGGAPQTVNIAVKLDVLAARAAYKRDDGCYFLVSMHSKRTSKEPLPVMPERVMVLSAFSSAADSEQVVLDMLKISEWQYQTLTEGGVSCGVPEIDNLRWSLQRSDLSKAASGGSGKQDLQFLEAVRPLGGQHWDLDIDPVISIPLRTYKDDHPGESGNSAQRGVAAVCLIGLSGINKVVRLSEPVVVVLDPDKPDVSVTAATGEPLTPERVLELQVKADELPGLLQTFQVASYQASFGASNDFSAVQKTTDTFRELRNGPDAVLAEKESFKAVMADPGVLTVTIVPTRVAGLTGESIVQSLGEPEKKVPSVYEEEVQGDFGSTEKKTHQVEWFHWAWSSAAVDKKSGVVHALKINAAQRRIAKPEVSP